jgi:hypothetical protein
LLVFIKPLIKFRRALVERLLVGFPHSLVVERSYLLDSINHSVSFAASWHGLGFLSLVLASPKAKRDPAHVPARVQAKAALLFAEGELCAPKAQAKTLAFLSIHPIYYSENNCFILTSASSIPVSTKTSPS